MKAMIVWAVLLLALFASPVFAQEVSEEQLVALTRLRMSLETVDEMRSTGILADEVADAQQRAYLIKVQKVAGKKLTRQDLDLLTAEITLQPASTASQISRYFTLVNIAWVTAAILMAIALIWLGKLHLLPLITNLSPVEIQMLAYAASIAVIMCAGLLPAIAITAVAFVGCLLLMGCVMLTEHYRNQAETTWEIPARHICAFYSALLAVIWGAVALWYSSSLIAFISVAAFVSALGFSVFVTPLCYVVGFEDDDAFIRATTAAGVMVGLYTAFKVSGIVVPEHLELFRTGVMWVGSFVFFVGLLIMASKYYSTGVRYICMQLLMIASGIAAISVGTMYGIATLQGIGGTLFYLYAIEKYFEIPWDSSHWAWVALLFSGMLYAGAWFANAHPTYFLF